jgi:phosphoglycolate phosphatase
LKALTTIECRNVKWENIQAVIFDKDGTLADSQHFWRTVGYKRSRLIDARVPGVGDPLLMAFGIQDDTLDPTGLMAVGSRQENEIAAAAYIAETGRGWLESLKIARQAFEEADEMFTNAAAPPLFVGCLDVIKLLADTGLKLGILSSDTTARVQQFVSHYQLNHYIELQMGVDSEPRKPDPALFLKACESLGVSPEVTLMVGDSTADMEMAQQAGAAGFIGICPDSLATNYLQDADVTISQLDLIRVIS